MGIKCAWGEGSRRYQLVCSAQAAEPDLIFQADIDGPDLCVAAYFDTDDLAAMHEALKRSESVVVYPSVVCETTLLHLVGLAIEGETEPGVGVDCGGVSRLRAALETALSLCDEAMKQPPLPVVGDLRTRRV